MQLSGATWIEIGMVAAGALGLLILLAPAFGQKPKRTAEGWLFPVKFTSLLLYWMGLAVGSGAVAYAGHVLLASAAANWGGWASFAFGFALVLLVLSRWPEPLVFDQIGLLKRGSPMSRIRWEELAYVRLYQIRNDRGIVIHSVYGKQLVVAETTYSPAHILDALMQLCPTPLDSFEDEEVPSIVTAPIPRVPLPRATNLKAPSRDLSVPRASIQRPE
jgi:hypothetical protein